MLAENRNANTRTLTIFDEAAGALESVTFFRHMSRRDPQSLAFSSLALCSRNSRLSTDLERKLISPVVSTRSQRLCSRRGGEGSTTQRCGAHHIGAGHSHVARSTRQGPRSAKLTNC